ncbi:hypothetical protein ACFOQM_22835 [Paenibacillus sp. GCM10012307]
MFVLAVPISAAEKHSGTSVWDIVPASYFEEYAGKFSTIEEVQQATGFTSSSEVTVEPTSGIQVSSIDEHAALLFYITDEVANVGSCYL